MIAQIRHVASGGGYFLKFAYKMELSPIRCYLPPSLGFGFSWLILRFFFLTDMSVPLSKTMYVPANPYKSLLHVFVCNLTCDMKKFNAPWLSEWWSWWYVEFDIYFYLHRSNLLEINLFYDKLYYLWVRQIPKYERIGDVLGII